MVFTIKFVVLVAAAALAVNAQSDTGSPAALPTNIDDCTITCITSASTSAGCSGITDTACICTSAAFQSAAISCLQSTCPSSDLALAQALQASECGTLSVTGTASAASGSATVPAASTTGSSINGSSTVSGTTSPSSAATPIASFGISSVFGAVFGIIGIIFGTLIV
ncbi:hypothetical protein M0805_003222 [Coniferiporia weirii]|nr:hypothetical protein M0805_003222 [Coniferiporia weirii]